MNMQNLLDYLFPRFCLSCDSEGDFFCQSCLKKIQLHGIFACPVCHKPTGFGVVCSSCRSRSFLDAVIALSVYEEKKAVGRLIHGLKYQYVEWLSTLFPLFFRSFFEENALVFAPGTCIIPVPLHGRRFAERGFNQADSIAHALGSVVNCSVLPTLKRTRYTAHQARLPKEKRLENVRGAFAIIEPVAGKRCILVDDVFTTGTTMQECAKVLKQAGAIEVIGMVLARG